MEQHVISEWLLRAFAHPVPGRRALEIYDKATGQYATADPKTFMTEVDAHSTAIELGIGRIEGPAAIAARRLAKNVKGLPPGVYAVVPTGAGISSGGPPLSDEGTYAGIRLLVSRHQVPAPSPVDRAALLTYAGLMYQRSPTTEAAMLRLRDLYNLAAQRTLDGLMPGMPTGLDLEQEISRRRRRMVDMAADIGARLAGASWWVVRAAPGEAFVLGDTPVAGTISLGHDDEWRAILSPETFAVVMPIRPEIALVFAPQRIMPITGIEMDLAGVTQAINRLMWRHAGRYVAARERAHLEAARPEDDVSPGLPGLAANIDVEHVAGAAFRDVLRITAEVRYRSIGREWQRWEACRIAFGWHPWAAEDRHLFALPCPAAGAPGSRVPLLRG